MLKWVWLSILVAVLDQLTKLWVDGNFSYAEQRVVIDGFFNLILVYNTGAAFSFLADAGGWQRWFFTLLTIAISIYLIIWLRRLKPSEIYTAIGMALIVGGAIGNLIDRLLYGHVIDFLLFYYQQWSWPAFNLADSSIFIGVVLMVWQMWREH